MLFKLAYLDKVPSPATMAQIKAHCPLNEAQLNRLLSVAPDKLAHINPSSLPRNIRYALKANELCAMAICDDCTHLIYAEILKNKQASTVSFMARALLYETLPATD
jgi:hypothetical protein